jgi:AraC-like DNA-binding protein
MKMFWGVGQLDTLTQLRRLLRVAVLKGHVSAEEIAESMAVSRRTLHRRLCSLGTRFEEVLGDTRFGFAEQLLSDTRLNISEISTLVGYADPSILTRLFRRRTGISPTKWRELKSNALRIPAVSAVQIPNLTIGKSA